MKPNRSTNWIYIALSCLGLALLILLLVFPVLAKRISDPIQPEKLDVTPIPVPEPPLVINKLAVSATSSMSPSASNLVPQPIPVPTPLVSATQSVSSLAEGRISKTATIVMVSAVGQPEFIAITLMFLILLIWIWLHRAPGSFHYLHKESV